MSKKEALHILMMSPFYFKLSISQRQELINEFIEQAADILINGFVPAYD